MKKWNNFEKLEIECDLINAKIVDSTSVHAMK